MIWPKVLVLSHNCFSTTTSNGRTLASLFEEWDKNSIAQFYITDEIPNFTNCSRYYRITDLEMMKKFWKKSVGKEVRETLGSEGKVIKNTQIKKTTFKFLKKNFKNSSVGYLGRNLIWNLGNKKNQLFNNWLDSFAPDVLLLQMGDYEFMFRLASKISKERKIPMVIYNTEDYYFKEYKTKSPFKKTYRYLYKKEFEKLYAECHYVIYNNEALEKTHHKEFEHKSCTLYMPTKVKRKVSSVDRKIPQITYLGNLGVGRHIGLIEIAKALKGIDKNLTLRVYGKFPNEDVEKELTACESIQYEGFVSYEDVVRIMKESDLIVHAENFSEFHVEDLKHAFSTKVADALACGTPFLLYAPKGMAITDYLLEKRAAGVVTEKHDLEAMIKKLLYDKECYEEYKENAQKVVEHDFNPDFIHKKILNIMVEMMNEN